MLAGGGRMKPMYIFPSPSEYRGSDQWILRKGFLRGEHLTEWWPFGRKKDEGFVYTNKNGKKFYLNSRIHQYTPIITYKFYFTEELTKWNTELPEGYEVIEDEITNIPYLVDDNNNIINETIMDDIPLEQFMSDNPEVVEILDRFPETLQRELAVERKNPQEFVEDFRNYYLTSPASNIEDSEPTVIKLSDELDKEHTIDTMSRTPQDVVDVINKEWGTEFESVKVFDPNPARYFEYAKFPADTAKPSLMVNGEILYGVARFIAALLRGDETMEVWDITRKENINEHKESKLNPELMIGDEILVLDNNQGKGASFNPPKLYTPYVVIGIKHPNKYQPSNAQTYYEIEAVDITDEERLGELVAGGGRRRLTHLYPNDTWMLRPGFLRGELNEDTEIIIKDKTHKYDKKDYEDFINYVIKELDIETPFALHVEKEPTGDYTGGTYRYKGGSERIKVRSKGRSLMDILRSIAHELVHHKQKEDGKFEGKEVVTDIPEIGGAIEDEANAIAGRLIKKYGEENEHLYESTLNEGRKNINEHKKTELSPELEVGDIIRVIDIDREVESNTLKYNIPLPEVRPEMFVSYEVVDKESNGHKSKWPWRYTLVPEGEIEITGRNPYGEKNTNIKLLYPWVYQWIYADVPMATKVDRKTISEHNQPELSPDLEEGDIIRVIGIDGEHARMPDRWGVYVVKTIKQDNATQEFYYDIVPYPEPELPDVFSLRDTLSIPDRKTLYHGDTWIYADVDRKTISEQKQEFNQPLTMGDVIRVVDVDKESTYELPTYPYDTGNASGNSLMTPHHRGRLHGDDTYPRPMKLYAVMSKSLYRTKDRDYVNPYWMLWPVDNDGKVEAVKDFHEIILTEKDTWMTIKKHHSNIPGDIEAKQKEYDDSGRSFLLQPKIVEQVMMKKVDMLKSDIITFLTNRFILSSTDYSELKDNKGNYYRIIDMKDPYEHVTLSDLIEPAIEFVSSGIKSGDFEEEDMNTALTAITNWVSLEMNQKKELVN